MNLRKKLVGQFMQHTVFLNSNFRKKLFKKNRKVLMKKRWKKKCWLEMTDVAYVKLEKYEKSLGQKEIQSAYKGIILLRITIKKKHIEVAQKTFNQNDLHSHRIVDNCIFFGNDTRLPNGVSTMQVKLMRESCCGGGGADDAKEQWELRKICSATTTTTATAATTTTTATTSTTTASL